MLKFRPYVSKALAAAIVLLLLVPSSLPFVPRHLPAPPLEVRAVRAHDFDVQHYRIAVSFDWKAESVSGETTITFRPLKEGFKELELDAGKMRISGVRLAGGKSLKFRYEGDENLFVSMDRPYPAGQDIAVTINYSAAPAKGLTFITPTESEPGRPHQIWSQGEAEDNHYWFPCYDHPDDKATSELIATVDRKYEVISNGALIEVRSNRGGSRTWHWKMDKPFSSYLTSVVVGEFAQVKQSFRNTPVVSYVYRDQLQNAELSFGKLSRMMEFFSKQIGYDYPYSKYAQTTVRDFEGGMENITATTLTDTAVHDRRAHLDVSSDELISHEMSHSWFGDMVTCRDWSDLWLNESFATLCEALWTEHDLGKDDYLYEMFSNQQAYFQTWFHGTRHPMVTPRYSNPDSLFDAYAYQRGGAVLNMLRFVLGEEMFWKAIRYYVRKYQWQSVDTSQLVSAIAESTGQNLQWFFDEWVYKMGHPDFEITSTYDGAHSLKLKVTQNPRPAKTGSDDEYQQFFTTPVDIAITTAAGERVHRVMIDKPEVEVVFEVDSKPLIVNFDRGNYLIKQVRFNRSDEELAYQATHDSDVTGRMLAAIQLKSRSSDIALKALSDAALRDRFWGVRMEAVRAISERSERARATLLEAVKDGDSRIRTAAIRGLAALKDSNLAELYTKLIATDPSYFVVYEAAIALGGTGSPRAFEVLAATIQNDSWQDIIRSGCLHGMVALKDPRSVEFGIKYASRGNPEGVRIGAIRLIGQAGKGNDRAFETLMSALKEPPPISTEAIQPLSFLGDPRAIPALEEFIARADTPPSAKQLATVAINHLKERSKGSEQKQ